MINTWAMPALHLLRRVASQVNPPGRDFAGALNVTREDILAQAERL